jgi:hypothetical protein
VDKTLDGALKLDFDTVIPGHGDLTDKAGLQTYRANLEKLRNPGGRADPKGNQGGGLPQSDGNGVRLDGQHHAGAVEHSGNDGGAEDELAGTASSTGASERAFARPHCDFDTLLVGTLNRGCW